MTSSTNDEISSGLKEKLARIRLLLCDVDGVLTDGSIWIGGDSELKQFDVTDGLGMTLLQKEGVKIGWISNRVSHATALRAAELKIDYISQGSGSKVVAIEEILQKEGVDWSEVCYVGDDIVDLGSLQRAGVGVAPFNACCEAKRAACYVTHRGGGHGAVREVVEMILSAQGRWEKIMSYYTA